MIGCILRVVYSKNEIPGLKLNGDREREMERNHIIILNGYAIILYCLIASFLSLRIILT